MPAHWTAAKIAGRLHQDFLSAHGFTRTGHSCERTEGDLRRTLTVITRTGGARREAQVVVAVAVTGLPDPVTRHRCDSLGGVAVTPARRSAYPLPAGDEPLSMDLVADMAEPNLQFLRHAHGLGQFILWAQEIFAGDAHPGWWRQFRPVLPQGTGPLQAAAFAAAKLGDGGLLEFLTARVENEEPDEHRLERFLREIRQLSPDIRPPHPIQQPLS